MWPTLLSPWIDPDSLIWNILYQTSRSSDILATVGKVSVVRNGNMEGKDKKAPSFRNEPFNRKKDLLFLFPIWYDHPWAFERAHLWGIPTVLSVFYRLRRNQIHVLSFTNSYFNPARQIRNRNSRWSYSTANINCKSLCLPMYTCGQHSLPQRLLLLPSSDHPSHHDQSTGFTSAIALRTYVVSLTKLRRTCSGFSK